MIRFSSLLKFKLSNFPDLSGRISIALSVAVFLTVFSLQSSAFAFENPLEALRAQFQVPALASAMLRDGEVTAQVAGVRKSGNPTPVESTDLFHLGSNTKAMTATLLAIYIERGKLSWESTLPTLLPELNNLMDPAFRTVTLAMLTAHQSGIATELLSFDHGELSKAVWNKDLNPSAGRKLVARTVLTEHPQNVPGGGYHYSNQNYMIAGTILERLTGKSWEELIQSELFTPLHMTTCGFGAAGNPTLPNPDQPWGHKGLPGLFTPVAPDFYGDNPPTTWPAGGVHCSLSDYAKFLKIHLDGFSGKNTPVLKAESFVRLHKVYPDPLGNVYTSGGWFRMTRTWAKGDVLNHNGSNTNNYLSAWLAPKLNMALIGASNVGGDIALHACDAAVTSLIPKTSNLR